MFFGTSAKTYFLPCAWLAAAAAITKARDGGDTKELSHGRILPG